MGQLLVFFFLFGTMAIIFTLVLYRFFDMFLDWFSNLINEITR